ncbi:MAG TPA: GNAT family N-acetyltransferase [Kineosporiaceae bacterium]|nr:GNAT family N-acetyltransferase [Kineosporiaceae bacterium]
MAEGRVTFRSSVLTVPRLGRVEVVTPAPRDVWTALAAADPGAQPTQLPQWLDCVVASGGGTDASRLLRLGDGRQILVPAVAAGLPGTEWVVRGWPHGWGYGGALTCDGVLRPDDARLVLARPRRPGTLWSTLTPSPWHGEVYEQVAPSMLGRTRVQTQVVDLDGGADAVWSRFRHAGRTSVRKAERAGLEITCGTGPEQLAAFGQLYRASERRWAADRGQPEPLARVLSRYRDRVRHVELVVRALPEVCTLWVARHEGRAVAANVVLIHGAHALGWLSGTDPELSRRTQGSSLLHWRTFVDAAERGARFFDLGESEPGSAVARYKAQFGAFPLEYTTYTRDPFRLLGAGRALRGAGVSVLARRAAARRT